MTDRDKSIVWVIQSNMKKGPDGSWAPKFDLSFAGQYGELEYVFGHGSVALMGSAVAAAIKERMKIYTDDDFLLLVGDNVLGAKVVAYLVREGFGPRALRWDNLLKRYDVIEL
jgi:hypothetical protein